LFRAPLQRDLLRLPPGCRIVLTFTLLMLQLLQSFSRAVLVFLTGPLGAGGGRAHSAGPTVRVSMALLGVIALMGMIGATQCFDRPD
jgi:Cu/Ag efflux pump CusA